MIKCICVDISNRPNEVPIEVWPKLGEQYHITHVIWLNKMGLQGVELAEIEIPPSSYPYEYYRLSRFGVAKEDMEGLRELMRTKTKMSEEDIDELFKKELVELTE